LTISEDVVHNVRYWATDNAGDYASSNRLRAWIRSGKSSDGGSSSDGSSGDGSSSGSSSGSNASTGGTLSGNAPIDGTPGSRAPVDNYLYRVFIPGLKQDE